MTGVEVTLPPGEVSVLLGPSGTGKSVFLKALIGLIKPEKGAIIIDDPEGVLAEAAGTAQPPRCLRGAEQVCEDAAAGEQNREQYAKLVQESRARSSWPPRAASR